MTEEDKFVIAKIEANVPKLQVEDPEFYLED
jgi:hypothetical protein